MKGVDLSMYRFLTNEEVGELQIGQNVGFVQFDHYVLARVVRTYGKEVQLSVEGSLEYEGRGEYRSGIGWGRCGNLFWLDNGMQFAPPDW